ncbi:Ras guanine nucleotide exchange factor A [Astathelohania contejeani]|uniref:Ras guanine nucleotide exchange factor A n=1 Tax=Astathelohania contejeani TaxID=164912 RepID=A0ABQ7I2F4_9MICR|nr:Ras guanine nucleotide exchange factor A [Thelohania contejeani]
MVNINYNPSQNYFFWDNKILPYSTYQIELENNPNSKRIKNRIEISTNINIYEVPAHKIAKAMTHLDLKMLKAIHPIEITDYDGSDEKCPNILLFANKNTALSNYISHEVRKDSKRLRYFFRVAKHLQKLENYNSLHSVIDGIRRHQLTDKQLDVIMALINNTKEYFEMRNLLEIRIKKKEFFIPPLEIILKDVKDSNKNPESEIASLRFCELIEFFVFIQGKEFSGPLNKKYEHFLLSQFYLHLHSNHPSVSIKKKSCDIFGLFLFL